MPRIALTPGEPAGIGPDLAIMTSQQDQPCEIVVIANPKLLEDRAKTLALPIRLLPFNANQPPTNSKKGTLTVLPLELPVPVQCGELNRHNSRYVLKAIHRATKGCLAGLFDAMVTGPVHKGIINQAGIEFTGHTEYIADLCASQPVMMLATPGLRVALVTTHLPLAQVSQAITRNRLRNILRILHRDLQSRFAVHKPCILVCGLNPHAGEGGHLGTEEIDVIEPVLDNLRDQGFNLLGPLPADTLFTKKYLDQADAVLAMYHDQGLPVLKYSGFGQAVNITLGLPIIRTSVDHGTALDRAGSGRIETGSLQAAIEMALALIDKSKN